MSHHNQAPYPPDGLQWDPVESLEELNKLRQTYIRDNPHRKEPPLPERPPQYIVDQHIPPSAQQRQQQQQQQQPGSPHSVRSSRSQSRLHGPRELPPRMLSSPVVSSPYSYDATLAGGRNSADYIDQVQSSPVSPYPQGDYFTKFTSSPFTTPTKVNGPRPHPGSSTSLSAASSPMYQPPSTHTSPTKYPLSLSVNQQPIPDPNYMDSPIRALPDIPVLTPEVRQSYDATPIEKRASISIDSPSLGRNSIQGPRLMPNNGSTRSRRSSPSTSPARNGYYDHRTSWKSEYSVNVMDDEDDPNALLMEEIDIPLINVEHDMRQPIIERPSQMELNLQAIDLPEITISPHSTLRKEVSKDLPEVPATLTLPSLPFSSRSLTVIQFSQCNSIYLLSDVFRWSVKLSQEWSDGLLVSKDEYMKALKFLFKHSAPRMNNYVMDNNIQAIMASFEKQNAIYVNPQGIIHFFDNVKVAGVFPQLTGCYSKSHGTMDNKYQCYSSRCSLTIYQPPIPIISSDIYSNKRLGEWATHWNLTKNDIDDLDEDEVKKQSHIFELIRQQQNIIRLGEIQVKEYGQSFKTANPQLLPDVSKFYNDAFNSVKPLIELHRKHLFEPLLAKLNTQGKYISDVGGIFLEWASRATVPYLKYTESLASVRELIKYEKSRHSIFAEWLYKIDEHPQVVAASLDHNRIFFSGFIGHTQLLSLALMSVRKKTRTSDVDYTVLGKAIDEVDKLNRKIDEMQEYALQSRHLRVLASQLVWKSNVLERDLKLRESMRRLIKRGEVTRKDKWTSSLNYLILLDNYLLITEEQKDGHYKICEKPIPVEFLQVESKDFSNAEISSNENESFPFKIRYTGQHLSFTFCTETMAGRDAWFAAYNQVKSKKSKASDFEPFKISVLSDQFAYEDGTQPQKLPVCVSGSNIDRMLADYQKSIAMEFDDSSISRPIMVSGVLSGTSFTFEGKSYHALGLNFGLFITEAGTRRGWRRVLDVANVTQIEKLDTLLVVLSDKGLFYFNLVSLLLNYYGTNIDGKTVGERLSKRDVEFFKIGSYYNTKLLFLMKKPIQSLGGPRFKVFTPIFDSFGSFQYFQLYRRFQHSSECYDLSIFNSMFVLHAVKGFEILSFQVMYESQHIPKFLANMKKPKSELEMIKKTLKSGSSKPLLMSKVLHKSQFYLVYDSFAIVIDTIGQLINDSFIFPFKFKCKSATLQDNFLICIGEDIVEVFDLSYDDVVGFQKLDPVQIINGKDIHLIDPINAKLVMAHPQYIGRQLIVSLEKLQDEVT